MEIAKSLVKCVARAFYDTKHILVIDALMIHNAVRDDELGKLLGLQSKDLQKLCGKLKEDRMLAVHTRPEQKEGQQRPTNRTYYYVEFRSTIDAVKYRMHGVVKGVEKAMNKDADSKGYVCPYCKKRYSVLDAMSLSRDDAELFVCDRCNTALVDDDDSTEVKTSQERLGRLMEQMKKIIDMLKLVDEIIVPQNDFETAISNSVPVPRDKNQLSSVPISSKNVISAKKNDPQSSMEVNVTATSEKTVAELASEQATKQAQAEKNALPVWHTKSTVDPGATTTAGAKEEAEKEARAQDEIGLAKRTKEEEERKAAAADGAAGVQVDAIAEYYLALQAQKAREALEEEEEEEDDDDDEEDEGEEDGNDEGQGHEGNGEVKQEAVADDSKRPVISPNASSSDDIEDSEDDSPTKPPAKKVKFVESDDTEVSEEEATGFEDI